jgi:hypothetical protein
VQGWLVSTQQAEIIFLPQNKFCYSRQRESINF